MKYQKDKNVKKYIAGGMFLVPAAIGAGQAIYGASQANQAKKMAAGLKTPSVSSPQEYAQMMKAAYDAELMNRQLDEINRSMATSVGALQQAGGRALVGGLPDVTRAANQATFEAGQFESQQRIGALGEMAGAQERQMGREMDLYNQQLGMAQAALNAGTQTAAAGIGQIGSAAMYGADAFSQAKNPGSTSMLTGKTSGASTPTANLRRGELNRLEKSLSSSMNPQEAYQQGFDYEGISGVNDVVDMPKFLTNKELQNQLAQQFGLIDRTSYLKEGGMVTGGKFSHKTNPIDIVQKGKKVGEMTGGEVILNPSQAAKLSKESAYFRKLLNKFNKSK
jgi:hypothetical protein